MGANETRGVQPATQPFCDGVLNTTLYSALVGEGSVKTSDLYASIIQLVGLLFLHYYCRTLHRAYKNGIGEGKDEVFLPVYNVYLTFMIRMSLIWIVVNMVGIFPTMLSGSGAIVAFCTSELEVVVVFANWAMFHFFFDIVTFLLLTPGFGRKSIRRAVKLSALTGTVSGLVIALKGIKFSGAPVIYMTLAWGGAYTLFFLFIWLWPYQKFVACGIQFYRRPAVRYYAMYWFFIHLGDLMVELVYDIKFTASWPFAARQQDSDLSICGHFLFAWLLWGLGWPIILIKTFRKDTIYWNGGFNNCDVGPFEDILADLRWICSLLTCRKVSHPDYSPSMRTLSRLPKDDIRRPLFQLGFTPSEVAIVRENLDSVPSDILIRFCELSLDPSVVLGSGGTARVFVGEYRGQRVAIKMITCFELTPEVVRSFFEEASLLYKCSEHPNILGMYGICVAPPTLCLILELAKGGDLTNDLKEYAAIAEREAPGGQTSLASLCSDRKKLLKFLSDAIQCAKAVEYLHGRAPPLLHRDIKSMNFLVTIEDNNAANDSGSGYVCPFADDIGTDLSAKQKKSENATNRNNSGTNRSISFSSSVHVADTDQPEETCVKFEDKMSRNRLIKLADLGLATVLGGDDSEEREASSEFSLLWAAPEVLRGGPCSKSSDVYSLIVVFWEIANAGLQPYDDIEDLMDISERIQNGMRPELGTKEDRVYAGGPPNICTNLRKLFENGWHENVAMRPTAAELVGILEDMQKEVLKMEAR